MSNEGFEAQRRNAYEKSAKILQNHYNLFQKMIIITIVLPFFKIFFHLCFVERTNKYFCTFNIKHNISYGVQ